jgi:hypothetical protein
MQEFINLRHFRFKLFCLSELHTETGRRSMNDIIIKDSQALLQLVVSPLAFIGPGQDLQRYFQTTVHRCVHVRKPNMNHNNLCTGTIKKNRSCKKSCRDHHGNTDQSAPLLYCQQNTLRLNVPFGSLVVLHQWKFITIRGWESEHASQKVVAFGHWLSSAKSHCRGSQTTLRRARPDSNQRTFTGGPDPPTTRDPFTLFLHRCSIKFKLFQVVQVACGGP